MKRKNLFLVAALIWLIPGLIITIKGLKIFLRTFDAISWWMILVVLLTLAFFYVIFAKVVRKYGLRISSLPEPSHIMKTFSPQAWCLLLLMMGLGFLMNRLTFLPEAFKASFYLGLGPMLLLSAGKFFSSFIDK